MTKPIGQGPMAMLRKFFAENPDEELTYEQALVKLNCKVGDLQTALWILKSRDEVEVVKVIRPKRVEG